MSGRHRDIADLAAAAGSGAHITDLSSASVILAVQGPGALATIARVSDASPLARLDYFKHGAATVAGIPCHVGRLGYTGEQGFEIIAPRDAGPALWQALSGSARPAGFTAADMLRIEAGFILFTNELAVPVTPTEAGVDRYAGEAGALGVAEITLVCLTAAEREIELPWQARWPLQRPAREGEVTVTSACRSPLADGLLLLGYARTRDLANGVMLRDAAGHFTGLRRVSLPFYDPQKRRPRAPLVP
jgi:glycine cleavage system aminomethyltransferase T